MNIIPEETIAVWARERRVLCKIFFISPSDLDVKGNKNPSNRTSVERHVMDGCIYYYS